MRWLEFEVLPLWSNLAIFAAAATAVWFAGTRIARQADFIARATGIGTALIGMLLLGGITSLPEIAVALSAGLTGHPALAVNNILGGVAMQIAVIALGDAVLRRRAISASAGGRAVQRQGIAGIVLLAMVMAGTLFGEIAVAGVGLWSSAVLVGAVALMWLAGRSGRPEGEEEGDGGETSRHGLGVAIAATAGLGALIVIAGYLLARTSAALAGQTGLGESFVGAIFTAISTSLPEISTVIGAVRLGRYVMAFSDIFGTNIFDLALIFWVDVASPGGPVLAGVGVFSAAAAALGALLTAIYLVGLRARRPGRRVGLGYDSWAVAAVYLGGVAVLYMLR